MTAGGEAFGCGARRDRDDEPATATACDGMVKAVSATPVEGRGRRNGAVETRPSNGH